MHGTVPPHRPPRILLPRASHLHLNVRLPRVAYLPSPLPEDDEPIPDRPPSARPSNRYMALACGDPALDQRELDAIGIIQRWPVEIGLWEELAVRAGDPEILDRS
jgi:hypothetical protein